MKFLQCAPMFKVTSRHFRYFLYLLSKNIELYTEMYVDKEILYNKYPLENKISGFKHEKNTVFQLASSNPDDLYYTTKKVIDFGYTKINLNCGCPSKRAIDHHGIVLMKDFNLTKQLCDAMISASKEYNNKDIELSLKCRNGVDENDSYEYLSSFINTISQSGITNYIIHARKGILGLSSSKNLKIPELNYNYTYQLLKDFPHLQFTINGGIYTIDDINIHLKNGVKSIMIGRGIRDNPCLVRYLEKYYYPNDYKSLDIIDVLHEYNNHIIHELQKPYIPKSFAHHIFLPIHEIFKGRPNVKEYKRILDDKTIPIENRLLKALESLKISKNEILI